MLVVPRELLFLIKLFHLEMHIVDPINLVGSYNFVKFWQNYSLNHRHCNHLSIIDKIIIRSELKEIT